jgi:hypothetical protein
LRERAEEYPEKRVYFKGIISEENYLSLHCYQGWAGLMTTVVGQVSTIPIGRESKETVAR